MHGWLTMLVLRNPQRGTRPLQIGVGIVPCEAWEDAEDAEDAEDWKDENDWEDYVEDE